MSFQITPGIAEEKFLFIVTRELVVQPQCVSLTSCTKTMTALKRLSTTFDLDEVSSHRISTLCSNFKNLRKTFVVLIHTNLRTQSRAFRHHWNRCNLTLVPRPDHPTFQRQVGRLTSHLHQLPHHRQCHDLHRQFFHQVEEIDTFVVWPSCFLNVETSSVS